MEKVEKQFGIVEGGLTPVQFNKRDKSSYEIPVIPIEYRNNYYAATNSIDDHRQQIFNRK